MQPSIPRNSEGTSLWEHFIRWLDWHGRVATFMMILVSLGGAALVNRVAAIWGNVKGIYLWTVSLLVFCVFIGSLELAAGKLYRGAPRVALITPPENVAYTNTDSSSTTTEEQKVVPVPIALPKMRTFVDVTPEYLIGFFGVGHTSIQAQRLAEPFIGKWMKISGSLGDVLGDSAPLGLVIFEGRSMFDRNLVNMFFKSPEWLNRLSTLKRGDSITVVGEIKEVNSLSVKLDNCEIADS
jgi:hypothetical protein